MGFEDGTTGINGVECEVEMQCDSKGKVDNWSREAESSSSGMSDSLQTYKRRKTARSSSEQRTSCFNDTGQDQIHSSQTKTYVSLDGPKHHLKRHQKNVLSHNLFQTVNGEKRGIKHCPQDVTNFIPEIGCSIVVEKPGICNGYTERCSSQTGPVMNRIDHIHDSLPGFIPNGSLGEPNCRSITEKCQRVFTDIIVSDKYNSLCKLISESLHVMKLENLLHLNHINSRMKEGVYEGSPTHFSEDLDLVWKMFNGIGSEIVSLSKSLSDISRRFCRDQVGCSMGGAVEEKHEVLEPCAKREPTEQCCVNRICTCRRCGGEADGRNCLVCDSCEEMYHITCIEPAVKEIPPRSWYCGNCTAGGMGSPHENCVVCERLNVVETLNHVDQQNCHRNGQVIKDHVDVSSFSLNDRHHASGSESLCKICGSDINNSASIVCEHPYCLRHYHERCLSASQLRSYGCRWYCPSCLCRSCLTDRDDDKIILCDSCDSAYHIDCLKPRLRSIPEGKWFCRKCRNGIQLIKRVKRAYTKRAMYSQGTDEHSAKETAENEVTDARDESDRSRGGVELLLTAADELNKMVTT